MKKVFAAIRRFTLLYWPYIISLFGTLAGVMWAKIYNSPIRADFSMESESSNELSIEVNDDSRVMYNYYLDYSPSMKGLFNTGINANMGMVADAIRDLNRNNEKNNFYRCMHIIDEVSDPEVFYAYMNSPESLDEYYRGIINNIQISTETDTDENDDEEENEPNKIDEVLNNMDLSKIFTDNPSNNLNIDNDQLNVIITDMNFLINESDWETHNMRIEHMAEYLGQAAADSNICIYAIASDYMGIPNDVDALAESDDRISVMFYLIIYSDNDKAYDNYCQKLEGTFANKGMLFTGKFELLNNLNDSEAGLSVNLSTYKGLNIIENENVNFANGLFKELKENEFAIQLVSEGTRGRLNMPVSDVDFPGYYDRNIEGFDDTRIEMEAEVYYAQNRLWLFEDTYEQCETSTLVSDDSANMYYNDGNWYIRVNIGLNTSPNVVRTDSLYQIFLNCLERRYLVLNLKIYMGEPSYLMPDWVDDVSIPQQYDADMFHIDTVIDKIIQDKKSAYVLKPQKDRYLGNIVIYVLY